MLSRLSPLLCAAFLAACATAPEPRLFLLNAPIADSAQSVQSPVIGLREVALPLYARRPQVAAQNADGTLIASDDHRWAEEPPRAATRLLARTIAAETGAQVFEEPWARAADPDVIVAVEVDRFIGTLGGSVVLTGQLSIGRQGGSSRPRLAPFSIDVATVSDSWDDLTNAYGFAIQRLGQFAAAELTNAGS